MKLKHLQIALVLTLLLVGVACEDNQPVELVDDTTGEGETEIEINVLPPEPDTLGTPLAFDTTGLLQTETSQYVASLVVSGVQFDVPSEHHEVSFAHAIFFDLTNPIWFMQHLIGFRALDVGKVFLDNFELHRIPHRIRRRTAPFADTLAGVRYGLLSLDGQGDRGFQYRPEHRYVWSVEGNDRVPPSSVSIESPGRVNIIHPTAESPVSKDHALEILWTGQRPEIIIISGVKTEPERTTEPLFQIRVPRRTQRIILPRKFLRLMPTDRFERFLFTFGASNSREISVEGFLNKVLLHVASVHNILVKIQ